MSANKNGSATSYNIWSGGSYGYRYIKYRACNATGCSGLSPWRRIYIYTSPGTPNNVAISAGSITPGGSATVSWTQSGGIVPAGYYTLYETKPGASEVQIASITASGSSYSRTVTPSAGPGSYSYRVRACNPANVGCGGSRTVSLNVIGTVSTPGISPSGRTFNNSISISMSTGTSGATLYYTTNGSTPTTSSTRYTGAFTITTDRTIRAIAAKSGWHSSGVRTEYFDRNYAPTFNSGLNPTSAIQAGANYSYTFTASDADNDSLTYRIANQPGGLSINSSTGLVSGVVNATGSYTAIQVSVTDGSLTTYFPAFTLTVTAPPPTRRVVYVHTDALGSPAAETDENGDLQ